MFDKVLSMPPVLNIPGFWIAQDSEYVSGFERARSFGYTRVLNMPLVLNIWEFWIYQSSEYVTVTQGSEYAWINPEYVWLCLNMSEYACICRNMCKYDSICLNGFCFTFPHFSIRFKTPILLEDVVHYLNVYRRLEVIVWRNIRLFTIFDFFL